MPQANRVTGVLNDQVVKAKVLTGSEPRPGTARRPSGRWWLTARR